MYIRSEILFYSDAQAELYNVISKRMSNFIPPQMKILNMVIPILIHFCSSVLIWEQHKAVCHPTKRDVINDFKPFLTVYRKFLTLSNQMSCNKSKCIRIVYESSKGSGVPAYLRSFWLNSVMSTKLLCAGSDELTRLHKCAN